MWWFFSAIIFCDFEKDDYCHWNRNPNSVNATRFGWKKFTSNELENSEIPGPPTDMSNNKDGHYILASNKIAINAGENAKAKFLSPYLIGKQHVEECFQFLVYLSVSPISELDFQFISLFDNNFYDFQPAADVLRVYKKIKDVAERVLLWELTASFAVDQPKWFEGQVKILAEETDGYEYRVKVLNYYYFKEFLLNKYSFCTDWIWS